MGDRGNSEAQEKGMLEKSHLLSLSLSQGYHYATWCYSSRGLRSRHLEWTCIIGSPDYNIVILGWLGIRSVYVVIYDIVT